MASRDRSGDGAQDPPSRPPLPSPPSPPSPSTPSPDRTPEPMRDPPLTERPDPVREPLWPEPVRDPPHPEPPDPEREPPWPEPVRDPPHPEHPDPARERPSDRPPVAFTFARIEARQRPRSFALPSVCPRSQHAVKVVERKARTPVRAHQGQSARTRQGRSSCRGDCGPHRQQGAGTTWRVRAGEHLVDQRHVGKPARRPAIKSRCGWPHAGAASQRGDATCRVLKSIYRASPAASKNTRAVQAPRSSGRGARVL